MPVLLEVIGIAAIINGGSSLAAHHFGGDGALFMRWAVDYQPFAGIVAVTLGVLLTLAGWRMQRRAKEA